MESKRDIPLCAHITYEHKKLNEEVLKRHAEGLESMRDKQIDALRAWGILLVVAGHAGSPFIAYIYTFHMPLFFFISGYLRYRGETEGWTKFICKKLKTTLIPYVAFWAISMLAYRPIFSWMSPSHSWIWVTFDEVKGLLLGGHWLSDYSNNFPLWYLQLFFIACVIFEVIVRYFNLAAKIIAFLALILVTIPFQTLLPGRPIFHINVLPAALVFMCGGYFLHILKDFVPCRWSKSISFAVLLLVIGWNLSSFHYGNVSEIVSLWYFAGAFCSIWGYYILCGHLSKYTSLNYVGKNTLYIMGLHSLTIPYGGSVSMYLMQTIGVENGFLMHSIGVIFSLLLACGLAEIYKGFRQLCGKVLEERGLGMCDTDRSRRTFPPKIGGKQG